MKLFGNGSLPQRLSRAGIVAGALALGAASSAADARSIRVCYMGDIWSIWVEVIFADTAGNYDATTGGGLIDFNTSGSQSPDDLVFPYVDNLGDFQVLNGPADMAMGTYEVLSGLGSAECAVEFPNIWITVGNYGIHYVPNPGVVLAADMQLVGFTPDGQGLYEATGLSIPVQFEVTQPDGTVVIVNETCTTLELRTPLSLAEPCKADCNEDGVLNVDDIDCFVASFLGGCV